MKKPLYLLKVGGKLMDDHQKLDKILDDFCQLAGFKVLVHGGGNQASSLSSRLGIRPKMVQGRRITDAATLEVAVMVYAGLVNKNLVARLQAKKINALGLTGADGNTIPAIKRPVGTIDFGFAGDIPRESKDTGILKTLLENNITPVFCALTHDGKGQLLNTNADTIAAHLASTLSANYEITLIYCFDKPGVLRDAMDHDSLIYKLTKPDYEKLRDDGRIAEGMLPKLENAFSALYAGCKEVYLCGWDGLPAGSSSLKGTRLCLN